MMISNYTLDKNDEHDLAIQIACEKFEHLYPIEIQPTWLKYCISMNVTKNSTQNWVVKMKLRPKYTLRPNECWVWHAKLDSATVLSFEKTGKKEFKDAYSLQYNTIRDEISKELNLYVTTNIYNEILPEFFKAATLEPKFTAISDKGRMNDLIMLKTII